MISDPDSYRGMCNNCKFWEASDTENYGICKFVSEKNPHAYLVHEGGNCLITVFAFYCGGHEFKNFDKFKEAFNTAG